MSDNNIKHQTTKTPPKSLSGIDDNGNENNLSNNLMEDEIRRRIIATQKYLDDLNAQLSTHLSSPSSLLAIPEPPSTIISSSTTTAANSKAGYLWKWNDRQIGWGGTKWDLRFVKLDGVKGEIAYYRFHTTAEDQPRYVLSLKGCAVRDDGKKSQKKKAGSYFYVFSIYYRGMATACQTTADEDDETKIVPLVRFSTESEAEHTQWMELISDTIAYCEVNASTHKSAPAVTTDSYTTPPMPDRIRVNKSFTLGANNKGTLPPIYYGKTFRKKKTTGNVVKSNPRTRSGYPPSRPMHQSAEPSYLSEDAPNQNYRGFLNLAMIILFISNFRLICDSFEQHGLVVWELLKSGGSSSELFRHYTAAPLADFPFFTGELIVHTAVLLSYAIERGLARGRLSEMVGMLGHFIVTTLSLAIPTVIVWYYISQPVVGCLLIIQAIITWAKLISYAHANSDYRQNEREACDPSGVTGRLVSDVDETQRSLQYPQNVTLGNAYYFFYAPTLTYQIAFPRNRRIRWFRVLGLLIRMALCMTLLMFLVTQTIVPRLEEMQRAVRDDELSNMIFARTLVHLAIPNTYVWLVFFYLYFHLLLNLCAELLRFGDCVFYKDWWNSSEVSAYWRLWNMPVHYWLIRHVYFPAIRCGMGKTWAMVAVFFISAVFHELMASVPFKMVRMWSFLGMMGQIPLVALTKRLDKMFPGSSIGNIIFWLSFCCIGQPMAICCYAVDYWKFTANGNVLTSSDEVCTGTECEL